MDGGTQTPCLHHTSEIAPDKPVLIFIRGHDILHYLQAHANPLQL